MAMDANLSTPEGGNKNDQPYFAIGRSVLSSDGDVYFSGVHRFTGVQERVTWHYTGDQVAVVGPGDSDVTPFVNREGQLIYVSPIDAADPFSELALFQGGNLVVQEKLIPGSEGWRIGETAGFRLSDGGDILVQMIDNTVWGLLKTRLGGPTAVIAKGGSEVPEIPGFTYQLTKQFIGPKINPIGDVAFRAQIEGTGPVFEEAILRSTNGGALELVARTGVGSPLINAISNPAINESDITVYSVQYADFSSALVMKRPGEAEEVLLTSGVEVQTQNGAVTFSGLYVPPTNDIDSLVFGVANTILAVVEEQDPVFTNLSNTALWQFKITDNGLESLRIAREGSIVSGFDPAATWLDFQHPVLTRSGKIVFYATLSIPGAGSADSLWITDENELLGLVAVTDFPLNLDYFYGLPDDRVAPLRDIDFAGSSGGFDGVVTGVSDNAEVTYVSRMEPVGADLGPGRVVFVATEPEPKPRLNPFIWRDDAVEPYDWTVKGHWNDAEGNAVDSFPGELAGDSALINSFILSPVQLDQWPLLIEIEDLTAAIPGGLNVFSDLTVNGEIEANLINVEQKRLGEPSKLTLNGTGSIGRLKIESDATVDLGENAEISIPTLKLEKNARLTGSGTVRLQGDSDIKWQSFLNDLPAFVNEAGATTTVTVSDAAAAWNPMSPDLSFENFGALKFEDEDEPISFIQKNFYQHLIMGTGSELVIALSQPSMQVHFRAGSTFTGSSIIRFESNTQMTDTKVIFSDDSDNGSGFILEDGANVQFGRPRESRIQIDSNIELRSQSILEFVGEFNGLRNDNLENFEINGNVEGEGKIIASNYARLFFNGDLNSDRDIGSISVRNSEFFINNRLVPTRIRGEIVLDNSSRSTISNSLLLDDGGIIVDHGSILRISAGDEGFEILTGDEGGALEVFPGSTLIFESDSNDFSSYFIEAELHNEGSVSFNGVEVLIGGEVQPFYGGHITEGHWTLEASTIRLHFLVFLHTIDSGASVLFDNSSSFHGFILKENSGVFTLRDSDSTENTDTNYLNRGTTNVERSILNVPGTLSHFGNLRIRTDGTISAGRIEAFAGSLIRIEGSMEYTEDGFEYDSGENTLKVTGEVIFHPGSEMINNGILDADFIRANGTTIGGRGQINASILSQIESVIVVGSSPGTFTVNGDYSQDAQSELQIELGDGVSGVDYDLMAISNTATLAGTLALFPVEPEFIPEVDQTFTLLTAGTINGVFDHVANSFPNRIGFDLAYGAQSITATARYDSFANYAAWASTVFTAEELAADTLTQPLQDGDGDGIGNVFEYAMALQQGFFDLGPLATFQAVEETTELQIRFPWDNNVTDATFKVQTPLDLDNWIDNENLTSEVPVGGTVLKTYTIPAPQNGDSLFVRILVDLVDA